MAFNKYNRPSAYKFPFEPVTVPIHDKLSLNVNFNVLAAEWQMSLMNDGKILYPIATKGNLSFNPDINWSSILFHGIMLPIFTAVRNNTKDNDEYTKACGEYRDNVINAMPDIVELYEKVKNYEKPRFNKIVSSYDNIVELLIRHAKARVSINYCKKIDDERSWLETMPVNSYNDSSYVSRIFVSEGSPVKGHIIADYGNGIIYEISKFRKNMKVYYVEDIRYDTNDPVRTKLEAFYNKSFNGRLEVNVGEE